MLLYLSFYRLKPLRFAQNFLNPLKVCSFLKICPYCLKISAVLASRLKECSKSESCLSLLHRGKDQASLSSKVFLAFATYLTLWTFGNQSSWIELINAGQLTYPIPMINTHKQSLQHHLVSTGLSCAPLSCVVHRQHFSHRWIHFVKIIAQKLKCWTPIYFNIWATVST